MLNWRKWEGVRFGEAHSFHSQGPRMGDKEPRRQDSERTPSRGIWKNPQPVDWSLISHSGPPALESSRKIIKDTDSLVPLVPPNQGPGVKA